MNGKLEKILILAFENSKDAETGGRQQAKDSYEALINPESYSIDYKQKMAEGGQGHGTSGKQIKFECTLPEELTLEFLFDNTGIINGVPKPEGIANDVEHLQKMLMGYQGSSHEPYHFKLIWGDLLFKGRATELSIAYKLFNSNGQPIRATAKVKFIKSIDDDKRAAQQDNQSPDLTHLRTVGSHESLPVMCYRIYGNPKYYLQIAQINNLEQFRYIKPGTRLMFPPLDKGSS